MGAITNESKDTTHHMRDGEVVIAKRPNTQKWQMRIKMPDGSWKHQSTKTVDLDLAKKVAKEICDDIRWSVKKGLPLDKERKFNDAAEIYGKQQLIKRQPVLAAIEALAVRVLFVKRAVRVSREESEALIIDCTEQPIQRPSPK